MYVAKDGGILRVGRIRVNEGVVVRNTTVSEEYILGSALPKSNESDSCDEIFDFDSLGSTYSSLPPTIHKIIVNYLSSLSNKVLYLS